MSSVVLPVADGASMVRVRLQSLAQDVLAFAADLRAGLAVSLRMPVQWSAPGVAPVCECVEAFADSLAVECEHLQTRLRQGPRVLAFRGRCSVLVADLSREERWPVFRTTALTRHGLAGVQVEPLGRDGPVLGTLAWYTYRAVPSGATAVVQARRDYAAGVSAALVATHRTAGPTS
jgi:hypothetical protein